MTSKHALQSDLFTEGLLPPDDVRRSDSDPGKTLCPVHDKHIPTKLIIQGYDEWQEPLPLRGNTGEAPVFPVEVLPDWLRDMVSDVAVSTQTSPDMAGSLALGVLAMAGAGKIQVEASSDWHEPLNLYIMVALPSGSLKSAVFKKMTAPLEKWEEAEQEKQVGEIARARTKCDISKQRLRDLEKKTVGGDEEAESEALDLAVEMRRTVIPAIPRLLTSDATSEAVVRLLKNQQGRLGLFSSEGGEMIAILSGRYSKNGQSNIEVFLKAHSGDTIIVDRADRNREPIIIRNPALTAVLCLQPSVLKAAIQCREFRDRGLLARFLCVQPPDLMGSRDVDPPVVSEAVKNTYEKYILRLLDIPWKNESDGKTKHLTLTSEAKELLLSFRRILEPKLGPEGQYRYMKAWTGKLHGTILRIAGILHLACNSADPKMWEKPICESTMRAAIETGEYYASHFERIQKEYGESRETSIAHRILDKIESDQSSSFSERDIYRYLGKPKKEILASLKLLEETGHIRRAPPQSSDVQKKLGRKPSPKWEVNPSLLTSSGNYVNSDKGGLDE